MTKNEIEKVRDILIEEGQKNGTKYGIHLGENIKFTPTQVEEILKDYYLTTFCDRNGCDHNTQMWCCGCQDRFKWEREQKEKKKDRISSLLSLEGKTPGEIVNGYVEICKIGSSKDCRIYVEEAKRHGFNLEELNKYLRSVKDDDK